MSPDLTKSEPPPLVRPPLVEAVAERLLSDIRLNNLQAGTRLPPMADMARNFGVAPTTVREALRRLEAIGAVSVRHGVGVFVRSDASRLLLLNPDRIGPDEHRLASLIEARQLLEPPLAEKAAHNRTKLDIVELARLLESAEHNRSDRVVAGRLNLQFHGRIALTAGNPVLSDMLFTLLELHQEDQLVIDRLFDDPDRDHLEHVSIFNAISARKPKQARELMESHLTDVLASLEHHGHRRSPRTRRDPA